jgi:tetratricopeptide (TPR) repeat protein
MDAHDFARAEEALTALSHLRPRDPWTHLLLSDALLEQGRQDEAEQALQRVLDLKPTGAAYMRASYLLHLRGADDVALQVSGLAVEACTSAEDRAWAHLERGDLHWHGGRLEAAEADYTVALRLQPSLGRAKLGLGRVHMARGAWSRAAALFAKCASTPRELGELASLQAALGRRRAARETLRRARRMVEADRAHWARSTAVALSDHGVASALAVSLAREELARRGSARGWDALAWALTRAGRGAEALEAARRALDTGLREPLVLFHAGMAAAAAGEPELAATWLREALAANPNFHVRFPALARETLRNLGMQEESL